MSDLERLALAAGLAPEWQDYRGVSRRVAPDTLEYALGRLGFAAESAAQIRASRAQLAEEAQGQQALLTADAGAALPLPAGLGDARQLEWQAEHDRDRVFLAQAVDGRVQTPTEPGYYRLHDGRHEARVAVAPASGLPAALRDGARRWGLAAQIYSLPRAGDGGIGDFAALGQLAAWAAKQGADALAMSPAHALFTADLRRFSPYAPSSRLFLNVLYGDVGALDGEAAELVDWPRAAAARLAALRAAHAAISPALRGSGEEARAFTEFLRQGGARLVEHARFEALSTHFAQLGLPPSWREWPAEFHDPQGEAVAAFAATQASEVEFHLFAQWRAATSLAAAQQRARDAGMAIGLIGDLAVGTDAGGSHAWSLQSSLLQGLSVGAPPDPLGPQGQNWGLTTFSPRALHTTGYAPFIELLRANLSAVGGLRIDHILGLARLWVAPEGRPASEGVYLKYPLEDLLRLIRLEAHRHQALVIGEDLGTVPPGLRDQLGAAGVLGMQVLWFERDHRFFVEPQRWSPRSMATTTTHDLPTIAGWWQGRDLDWRAKAAQFGEGTSEASERAARDEDRRLLWGALRHQGLVAGDAPGAREAPAVIDAAVAFVAMTPAPLALLPVEDLLGLVEQPNVPGTIDEHPNWQRRLPVALEDFDANADAMTRAKILAGIRPRA